MVCKCDLIDSKWHNPCMGYGTEDSKFGIIGDVPHKREPGLGAFRLAYREKWPFRRQPTSEEDAVWSLLDLLGCQNPYSTQFLKCPASPLVQSLSATCFDRHLKAELREIKVKHWLAVGLMVRVKLLSMGAKQSKVYGPPKRGNLQDTMAVLSMDNVQIICLGSPFTTKDWPKEAHRYIKNTIKIA